MAKPIDEHAQKILKELKLDPKECLWDCHGTWVMYHRFVEIAGVKKGISIDNLEVVESNTEKGIAVVKCTASHSESALNGSRDKTTVITFGEVSPKNNRNAYPFAMAEKRAIDRAYLKLLGLHGFIYSEDEMDLTSYEKSQATTKSNGSKKIQHPDIEYKIYNEKGEATAVYSTFNTYINAVKNLSELDLHDYGSKNKKELDKHQKWIKSSECDYSDAIKFSALALIDSITKAGTSKIEGE